jgi:nucleoside-diphosphate-sugar epimerase
VGCGDVGLRLVAQLKQRLGTRIGVYATARRDLQREAIRKTGAVPVRADLDRPGSVKRLSGLASWVIHLAPPSGGGVDDPRTARLISALGRAAAPARTPRWVYVSTTGVYGDCQGARVDESRPVDPQSERAARRVAAEQRLRVAGARGSARITILRAPGIYAGDRLPMERLRAGTPVALDEEDVWTNHIHAEDLAWICWLALARGAPNRPVNAVDDSDLKMGEYFDRVADALGLARPPRIPRAMLADRVSPMMLSFMSESRRLRNDRLRHEMRVRLRFPTVDSALA